MNKNTVDLKVKIIGGNGAFNLDNSSFLIYINDFKILFDCSENSFQYIKENDINVDLVYITHTHMSHINGLEKLIYYNYFFKKKETLIFSHKDINIEKYLPKEVIYLNGELIPVKMYEHITNLDLINNLNKLPSGILLDFLKGNHIVLENYGLIINNYKNKKLLIFTGDTKATYRLVNYLKRYKNYNKIVIFHDFNPTGKSINCIHCCSDDFNEMYKELLEWKNIEWFKYHNTDFNNLFKNKTIKF